MSAKKKNNKRGKSRDQKVEKDQKLDAVEEVRNFKTPAAVALLLTLLVVVVTFSVIIMSLFGNMDKRDCKVVSVTNTQVLSSDCGVMLLRELPFHSIDIEEIKRTITPGETYSFTTKGIVLGPLLPTVVKVESIF